MIDKKFISEIITEDELNNWNKGDRILISSSTGTGKTQFILNDFYIYLRKNNLKAIFLVNRLFLKSQVENFLPKDFDKDIITIKTYQNLETKSEKYDYVVDSLFDKYDVVIFDEVHYLLTDSSFSKKTDIILKYILKDNPDKIFIFMSATPYGLTETKILKNTRKYELNIKIYDYIEKLYFYNNLKLPKVIIENIPKDEKILFFGAASTGYELSLMIPDSAFICATTNKKYGEFSSNDELKNIIEKEKFLHRILFTTRVMVNGVTIKDEKLKHIIIDDSLDVIELMQMIGRKRILSNDDKFFLYIRNHQINAIKGKIRSIERELKKANEYVNMGYDKFQKKNKKEKLGDLFDSDAEINLAKKYSKEFQLSKLKIMVDPYKSGSYASFVGRVLGVPECTSEERWTKYMFNADKIFKFPKALDVLEKYYGEKIYKEDQWKFKEEFLSSLLYSENSMKRVGIQTIQGILADNKMPYTLETNRETKGDKKGRCFWMVKKIV